MEQESGLSSTSMHLTNSLYCLSKALSLEHQLQGRNCSVYCCVFWLSGGVQVRREKDKDGSGSWERKGVHLCKVLWPKEGTYSEKPFHFRRYSTCPLTTRLSSTFSTTYSSSSSEEELSAVRLVFFPMSHAVPPEGLRPPGSCKEEGQNDQNPREEESRLDGMQRV